MHGISFDIAHMLAGFRVLTSDMALLDDTALKERFQQFMRRRASC